MNHAPSSLTTRQTELWQALPDFQKEWPVLSHSQLDKFIQCGFEWYLGYKLGYAQEKGRPLEVGSLIHEGLASLYTFLRDVPGATPRGWFEAVFPELVQQWMNSDAGTFAYASHATWILDRYTQVCDVMDLGHQVWAVEYHFLIPMTTRKGRNFLLQGYVDLITVDSNGVVWLWDHKSGERAWQPSEAEMHTQLPLYIIAMRELGVAAQGQLINFLSSHDYKRKDQVKNDQLFKRDPIYRPDAELVGIARTVLTRADEWLEAREAVEPPLRNMRRDCKYCSFRDACRVSLSGTPVEDVLDATHSKKSEAPRKRQSRVTLPEDAIGITLETP